MFEGSPLRYYRNHQYTPLQFSFFEKFGTPTKNMSEDLMMPQSPNSIQSDSDNSVSSVEVSPSVIQSTKNFNGNIVNKTRVQCCWRSCGIHFDSLEQLAHHVSKAHSASGTGGLFYCGWEGCTRNNRGFNARYKMLVHVRTHTNEKPHQCNQCDKSFSRAENLKIHSRSHSGEKPYICPVPGCNKAYSNSSDRFKHTRTHQVEKPYQCKVPGCPKRYTDPSSLRKHVKTYKHFVNENNAQIKTGDENITTVNNINASNEIGNNKYEENIYNAERINPQAHQINPCNCPHNCCMSNSLTKAAGLLKLGGFINFPRVEIKSMSWNKILDPFIPEPKGIFSSYELNNDMDLEVPLDLSISHKHL